MFAFIEAAGWPVWPLVIASIIALAIIGERAWSLRTRAVAPPELLGQVVQEYRQVFSAFFCVEPYEGVERCLIDAWVTVRHEQAGNIPGVIGGIKLCQRLYRRRLDLILIIR